MCDSNKRTGNTSNSPQANAPEKNHRRNIASPKGLHRGIELFGPQLSRLHEPGYRELITQIGLIVVEGFNDIIGHGNHGLPAPGFMSNRMTEQQGEKIARFARQLLHQSREPDVRLR